MAIVIEEEKKNNNNLLAILGWVITIGIVCVAIYYVFLVSPTATVVVPSGAVANLGPISSLNLNAQNVVNTPQFQALKNQIPVSSSTWAAPVGRQNPFVSP